jgi:hypothetical protein
VPVGHDSEAEEMTMHYIMGELVIARPIDEVFDFVADMRHELSYDPELLRLDKITPNPIAEGARFAATFRTGRRHVDAIVTYTAVERLQRIAWTMTASSSTVRGTLRFERVADGTRLRWCWNVRPVGIWRVMGPVLVRMGERRQLRMWTRLKEYLETTPQRTSVPAVVLSPALPAVPVP